MKLDVRNKEGKQVELVEGMWYVGVDVKADAPMIPASNWHWGAGEIAQYVGGDEFYDEDSDEPTRMQDYDYIVEQNMGRI